MFILHIYVAKYAGLCTSNLFKIIPTVHKLLFFAVSFPDNHISLVCTCKLK